MKPVPSTHKRAGVTKVTMVLLVAIGLIVGAVIYMQTIGVDTEFSETEKTDVVPRTRAQRLVLQAKEMLVVGQGPEAVEMMKKYLLENPKDLTVRPKLAELYLMLGAVKPAEEQLATMLSIDPNHPQTLWMAGMMANYRGEDPADNFTRAAEQPTAGPGIWGTYGLWLMGRGNSQTAKEYLDKAIKAGSQDGKVFMALGEIAFAEDQYDKALDYLNQAVRVSPLDPFCWASLSDVQKNTGKTTQAVASLHRALQLAVKGPIRRRLLVQLGMAQIARRQWQRAAEAFELAMQYPDFNGQVARYAAECRYRIGHYEKAAKHIDQAGKLLPPGNQQVDYWRKRINEARFGPKKKVEPPKSLLNFQPEPEAAE